jgi:glucokinase-like ROK family protein
MSQPSTFRTADQALVREINLSLIMRALFEHTSLSRAVLAEITGLNKSTVSSLVGELQDMRFIHEAGLTTGSVGRPSMMLELNPQAGLIPSCELGVDFISAKCANFGGAILWEQRETRHSDQAQDTTLTQVRHLLRAAIEGGAAACPDCGRVLGAALGVPGLVDQDTGTLLFAPNLRWENVPLCDLLHEEAGDVPVYVENEANLAALGEYYFGAAQGYDEVLFINIGVGLGGAVIRAGQIVRGKTGFASEFGHMTMDPDGEQCNCGNRGCWETQVSQRALFQHIRRAIAAGQPSALRDHVTDDANHLTVTMIVDAAHAGDAVAQTALDTIGQHLGIGIASLVNIFNPDLVLFGGSLIPAWDTLQPHITAALAQRALRWHANATRVMRAQHGPEATVMGGISVVLQHILHRPASYRAAGP